MKTKYNNDAIIGNKEMLATYSKTGELLRLYYPGRDYKQFIDSFVTGVKINDSGLIYLQEDINNEYSQQYIDKTNILETEIKNTYFNLKIKQRDCIPIHHNIVIKTYEFENTGTTIDLTVDFLIRSQLHSSENNIVASYISPKGLIQYSHKDTFCILAKEKKVQCHQLNDLDQTIERGNISDKDYVGMSADSAIGFSIGTLKPGEKRKLEIYLMIQENDEKEDINAVTKKIREMEKLDFGKEITATKNYWRKYLKTHSTITLKEEKTEASQKIQQIYERSILLFPLLQNQKTGGIIAAPEVDEEKHKCGRYAYCWTRDAAFITKALDILKMEKEVEKFYKNFCQKTQLSSGMWEQRYYTDGTLAPCWGYQIDETASVVYGVYEHYQKTKEVKFLKDNLKMCEKAVKYLKKYVEDLFLEAHQIHVSYDLWEMHEGTSLYSLSSIFAAFQSMLFIYRSSV